MAEWALTVAQLGLTLLICSKLNRDDNPQGIVGISHCGYALKDRLDSRTAASSRKFPCFFPDTRENAFQTGWGWPASSTSRFRRTADIQIVA